MSARFKPLPKLEGAQASAADPRVHAALSASAGTGKTEVLTARVLLLLLNGARPESILCLTFTKAAAAEMANRIMARLAAWVRLKDSELATDLINLRAAADPPTRRRARQLFARVLDCPGGLKIQTIHAFAQSLLASFPAEADIVPGFQPIEGRAEQELVRRTLADLLADAEASGDTQLIGDVQCLSRRLGEMGAVDYLRACASRNEALVALGPRDEIEPRIRDTIGLPEGSIDEYLASNCSDDGFDCDLLRAIADANRSWGKPTGADIVEKVERWLAMEPDKRASALPEIAGIVFTGKGELRKVQAGQRSADSDYDNHVQRLAGSVAELLAIQNGARLASDMAAGLRAGQAFAKAYTHAKRSAGVADFDDLIDWTRRLLAKPGMGEWVRYKLDRQVDHILVDEAQDTNAAQWEIIDRLVDEFFTGASEADRRWRTLFTVGDFKQAIYGFQGTDPEQFEQARRKYRGLAEALIKSERSVELAEERAREFRDLSIGASFRSAQPILDVVDSVIDQLGHEAIGLPQRPDRHVAHHSERAGKVELWPPFAAPDGEDDSDEGEERWVDVRDRFYAEELATRVGELIEKAPVLGSTGRPLIPGDILVLVRSRGELASLIVARLFGKGIPVAGVDRLHLHDPLAVQDLLAAVRFAVQPNDDLSLANLLVSPLIGWDQDRLRELAFGRKGPLWRTLRQRAGEIAEFRTAHDELAELLRIADFTTPSKFLETILTGPLQGRRKLYGRLGMASRDAIDELMNSAIEFERNEIASLDRFLSWFSRGDVDVQRDPAAPANEVRVMTVHGAKGLQAPVVILADATADPAKLGRTPITLDFPVPGVGTAPLLRPKKEERVSPFAELIEEQERRDLQEHWRLLYVALTRAADRLIVTGVAPKAKKDGSDPRPENCWHRAVQNGLLALGAAPVEREGQTRLVHESTAASARKRVASATGVPSAQVPSWAKSPAPPEARPPRPLAPSALAEDREAAPPPSPEMRAAAERGTLIHALLERLPPVAPEQREAAALRWLERSGGIADADSRREIANIVCKLISDSRFAALFGPGSLGEAPIAAALTDGRVIAGTVDRLKVEADRVLVVDYKTGRAPERQEDIPAAHRLQMQAYAEALSVIFPKRNIEAALLYTANGKFFTVDS
jgi:ATP-dependent helicase/nuclease subunit A